MRLSVVRPGRLTWSHLQTPGLLIGLALIVPLIQLAMGVPMRGYHKAHDGSFALSNFVQFQSELLAGNLLPHWSMAGNAGLGSPMFFFYPPGAYYIAALVALVAGGLPAATVIGLALIIFRVAALATCFSWLRRRLSAQAALTGSALYVLMPYVAMVNPQMRLAFSECAASMAAPLAFLAVDAGRRRWPATVVFVSAAVCALAFLNLPTTVLVGGLLIVYTALLDRGMRVKLGSMLATVAGIVLGLGIAGCDLMPATMLLHAITGATTLWDPNFRPENHFLLTANAIRLLHGSLQGLLLDISLLVPVLVVLICARTALRADPSCWALLGTFAVAVFLTLPLSAPFWALDTPLRTVQFPWRLLLPVSLLAAAIVATALPACPTGVRSWIAAVIAALAATAVAYAVLKGDHWSTASERTTQALTSASANSIYFLPIDLADRGWLDFSKQSDDYRVRGESFVPACVKRSTPYAGNGRLPFRIDGCAGPTALPQFYFPGWTALADTATLPVTLDDASGLVSVDVPSGTRGLELRRVTLPVQWLGLAVSAACLCLWIGIGLSLIRPRRTVPPT